MRLTLLSAVALMATTVSSAAAQQRDTVPPDSARTYEVEGVMVQVARPILTAGGSSAVIMSVDSLAPVPAPTLEQVLRTMPLIRIRTNSRGEAQPALRGSEDRQVAILMDGVPLSLGWDHRTDLSIIPLTAARDITLVRGLSSVLYGPNTLGGIVEVNVGAESERIHEVPTLALGLAVDHTGATQMAASGGAIHDGAFSELVVRGGLGFQDRSGLPVAGGAADAAALRRNFLSDGDLRLNSDVRRIDAFATARYLSDAGHWASIAASGYDAARGVPPEAHQNAPRLWRYPEQRRLVTAVAGGTGERETPLGAGDVEFSFGYDAARTQIDQYESEAFQTVSGREIGDSRTLTLRLFADHTLGDQGDIRLAGTLADVDHTERLEPGGAADYRQRLWSIGVESEWGIGGGSSRLNLGVALDGADTPETGGKPALDPLTDHALRVGLSRLVSDRLVLHASVSRRSRFPSLRELYSGALGRFQPNPDLRPETLLGAEAGVTAHAGTAEIQAVLFHHRLDDGIVRTSITDAGGTQRFMRVNQHEVRSTGLELLASSPIGPAFASGDLTLQSVQGFDPGGSEVGLEYQAAVQGRARITFPFIEASQVSGDLRYVGARKCENPEAGGLEPISASGVLDLSLDRIFGFGGGRGPWHTAEASLSISNVGDQLVWDQCGLPQPGRTFQLSLRVW